MLHPWVSLSLVMIVVVSSRLGVAAGQQQAISNVRHASISAPPPGTTTTAKGNKSWDQVEIKTFNEQRSPDDLFPELEEFIIDNKKKTASSPSLSPSRSPSRSPSQSPSPSPPPSPTSSFRSRQLKSDVDYEEIRLIHNRDLLAADPGSGDTEEPIGKEEKTTTGLTTTDTTTTQVTPKKSSLDECQVDWQCPQNKNERCRFINRRYRCECMAGYDRINGVCRKVRRFALQLEFQATWVPDLNNPSSEAFRELAARAEAALTRLLEGSPLNPVLVKVRVTKFYQASARRRRGMEAFPTPPPDSRLEQIVVMYEVVTLEKDSIPVNDTRTGQVVQKSLTLDTVKDTVSEGINSNLRTRTDDQNVTWAELGSGSNILPITILTPGTTNKDVLRLLQQSLYDVEAPSINQCENPFDNFCSEHARCFTGNGDFYCQCKTGYIDTSFDIQFAPGENCTAGCKLLDKYQCQNGGNCSEGDVARCICEGWYVGEHCEINVAALLGGSLGALGILAMISVVAACCCLMGGARRRRRRRSSTSSGSSTPSSNAAFVRSKKPDSLLWRRAPSEQGTTPYDNNALGDLDDFGEDEGLSPADEARWQQTAQAVNNFVPEGNSFLSELPSVSTVTIPRAHLTGRRELFDRPAPFVGKTSMSSATSIPWMPSRPQPSAPPLGKDEFGNYFT